ncbi:MAG: hypothetical protein ABL974_04615 [Prosthecobacter sp.]
MPNLAPLPDFISALFVGGEVAVAREPDFRSDAAESESTLQAAFQSTLQELPTVDLSGLALVPEIALASAAWFYRASLALADRAMPEEQVKSWAAALPAAPTTPSEVLSADITLRHLPELYALALSMSPEDPLVADLETAARRFPLSGIGIPLSEPLPDLSLLHRHPGLWRLYFDRVIERQDNSRLRDSQVARAIQDALGEHSLELAPKIAASLALDPPSSILP